MTNLEKWIADGKLLDFLSTEMPCRICPAKSICHNKWELISQCKRTLQKWMDAEYKPIIEQPWHTAMLLPRLIQEGE